jgi:leucyl aminopeptidase
MLSITFSSSPFSGEGALALGLFKGGLADRSLNDQDAALVRGVIDTKTFTGEAGKTLVLYTRSGQPLVLFGLGEADGDMSAPKALEVGGKLAASLESLKIEHVSVMTPGLSRDALMGVAQGMMLRAWRFSIYKKGNAVSLREATFYGDDAESLNTDFKTHAGVAESVLWARALVNEPGNTLTPSTYMERIRALSDLGLEVSALDQHKMKELGMGALLGVAQGSENPPFLGIVQWKGGGSEAPVAFVGKGVTFDSGGLSLKPSRGMEEMKGDMGGSAVVLGTMRALAQTKAPVNAVGVVALVENMPSGSAQRPGDIVTSLSRKTIEVLNTDAEGRLILADALTYAENTFNPRAMVDVATLTGAMRYALGPVYAGLFTPEDGLADGLLNAGSAVGEDLWRMPLGEAFSKAMEGKVSDLQNISAPGFGGGSSTAGAFLQAFVKNTKWAHLDIANVDFLPKDTDLATAGGCAFGVRLLYHWLVRGAEGV